MLPIQLLLRILLHDHRITGPGKDHRARSCGRGRIHSKTVGQPIAARAGGRPSLHALDAMPVSVDAEFPRLALSGKYRAITTSSEVCINLAARLPS